MEPEAALIRCRGFGIISQGISLRNVGGGCVRTLKRWFRRWKTFRAAQPQLATYRPEVERVFGGPVMWKQTGGCGRDVVCLVMREELPVGVLRVTVSSNLPVGLAKRRNLPFVPLDPEAKIAREWQAYATGFPFGLTPQPLWRSNHALLCAYVDGEPFKREADAGRTSHLALATEALSHIARLHQSGLTHMDMSLSNILRERSGNCRFVDFEYGPAEGLTPEQQRLYDYLRLLESCWKYIAAGERKTVSATWGKTFRAHAPEAVRSADIAPLRPALERILAAPELRTFFNAL